MRKSLIALVGAFALAPAVAMAYPANDGDSGLLVNCNPTDNVETVVEVSPGLSCDLVKNKIKLETVIDGCATDPAAPWDTWADAGYPSKMSAAGAATVAKVSLAFKSVTYGSCNFGGSADSFTASGGGKFALLTSADEKVKGGKGAVYATVGGDLATASAAAKGLVTKGFLAGAQIAASIGIDAGDSRNGNVLACNVGAACTNEMNQIPPAEELILITTPSSYLKIGIAEDTDCTGVGNPWACCTGAAAGNC